MNAYQVDDNGILRNFSTEAAAIRAFPESTPVPVTLPVGPMRREKGTGEIVDVPQAEVDQITADNLAQQLQVTAKSKIDALAAAYATAYAVTFQSSALGTPHTYISDDEGQKNLIGWASCRRSRRVWCDDGTGYKWILHTAAQIEQVLNDGADIKEAAFDVMVAKQLQVQAIMQDQAMTDAEKIAAIEAIV